METKPFLDGVLAVALLVSIYSSVAGLLQGWHGAPGETQEHLYSGMGCCLHWLGAVWGAGPRLPAGSCLS